jgi:hypothetical protein
MAQGASEERTEPYVLYGEVSTGASNAAERLFGRTPKRPRRGRGYPVRLGQECHYHICAVLEGLIGREGNLFRPSLT